MVLIPHSNIFQEYLTPKNINNFLQKHLSIFDVIGTNLFSLLMTATLQEVVGDKREDRAASCVAVWLLPQSRDAESHSTVPDTALSSGSHIPAPSGEGGGIG